MGILPWAIGGRHGRGATTEAGVAPVDWAAVEGAIRACEPAARLVWPRLLRRVIRQHARLHGFGLRVPHGKSYVIPREPLLEIADRDELGFGPDEPLPEHVVLLERLGTEEMAETGRDAVLLHYWRLLFHARVHLAIGERIASGRLGAGEIRKRIWQLGAVEFDEIRSVLRQERFLLPHDEDAATYVEFVAVYLELRYFAPGLLPVYFPALESLEAVDRIVGEDVDAEALRLATRLPGAPDPPEACDQAAALAELEPAEVEDGLPADASEGAATPPGSRDGDPLVVQPRRAERKYLKWMARAERAAETGNLAGAAIRRARAGAWAPPERSAAAATALRNDIHRLVARLQAALGISGQDPRPWREALLALAHQTPRGLWTVEARLLYDLQKVCVDHERGVFTVDVVEWVLSLGKRPIKRALPSQREVLMSKHLRSAAGRLTAVRISEGRRRRLVELLGAATQAAEARLREHFRPRIAQTLEDVALRPANLPERVARKKLVEELLDRIVDRGFLQLGDLRDALSRNNLKLHDCDGTAEFFRGDALLRADRRLALVLDGVYHRGEFYLRWMQRISLLAFGTRAGRFLTRFVAVPFGGAFLVLAFVEEILKLALGKSPDFTDERSVLALGLFFLGLIHVERFRRGVWEAIKAAGRGVRLVFVDSVRWLLRLPLVQRILDSRISVLTFRLVVKPLVPTLVIWRFLLPEENRAATGTAVAAIYLGLTLAINSRLGRNLEELAVDWIAEGWHRFGLRILTGLFWFVMDLFRRLLQTVERLLYTVDEWLRFKSGQSRLALVAKGALGAAWFYVTYVVRFGVNLLLEPQINPIKHFPVVTVSHKVVYGLFLVPLQNLLALRMNLALAGVVATAILFCIPGIFGFLVWELKENWRLYAANRRKDLGAVLVGHHGETMSRLLRPGFHSGTVPKRFAKLRRAARHAAAGETLRAVRKHREVLRHVEHAVRRYVEREFIELFADSPNWQTALPSVGEIRLTTNRIRIAVLLPGDGEGPTWIGFETISGWMVSGASGGGGSARLELAAQQVLRNALAGLYKTGGVELLRQQIEAAIPPPVPPYDLTARGLIVWPDETPEGQILYDLQDGRELMPEITSGYPRRWLPMLDRAEVVFGDVPIPWGQWVAAWESPAGAIGGWRWELGSSVAGRRRAADS